MELQAVRARRAPEPVGHKRYDLFNPFITCPGGKQNLNRIGDSGDGGKWLCDDLLQREDCVVFSLGSNGEGQKNISIVDNCIHNTLF
jgi:hypothetical protein